jgi:putative serine protease PepD
VRAGSDAITEEERTGPESRPGFQPVTTPSPRPRRGVLVSLLAGFLGAVVGSGATLVIADRSTTSAPAPLVRVAEETQGNGESLTGVAEVARTVLPSVVRIDVVTPTVRGRQVTATGSGVIFRSDGYVITNHHVVSGADSIEVTLSSGEKLPARLIGSAAPSDDIAVIKVDRSDLTPATLGSTSGLSVGDLAVAVGSPFGLEGSVTAGVISALHRNIDLGDVSVTDAIQTDAPINPGNSGGALANAGGEVIGINTAAVGAAGGSVGVGFAIPIEIAQRDAEEIIATGRAERPFLGISGESIPNDGGALVQEVIAGGPAAEAGMRAGDIIVEIEGEKIASMEELVSVLSRFDVGDVITVTYTRDGTRGAARVELRSRPQG